MALPSWIIEPRQWAARTVVADLDDIRRYNPQRFEMEQLTAVIYEDPAQHVCVGYKDVERNAFWVRGHLAVMPPTLICEAAAQLANYYVLKHRLISASLGMLGGLPKIRCRGVVRPGDRLVIVGKLLRIRGALLTCKFQAAVGDRLVCEGVLTGAALREPATVLSASKSVGDR